MSNLVGSLFNNAVKRDSSGSVTIDGDLTVTGTTTTISTTDSVITDKLIELANGTTGTPSGDAGIIVERGSSTNAAIIWDESADQWAVATTSATGGSSGDLSVTDANLRVSDIQVTGDITLDDGGSIKEAGGTAAITIDGDGHVTKIGQDSPSSGEFLKYDGTKWVSDAVAAGSSAADDITTGDAAVTIATSAGNITLDAQGNDTDIIFKGTDGGSDTTFLTLDGSEAGAASFNGAVTVGADLTVTGGDTTLGAAGDTTATTISTVTNTGTTVGKSLTISAGSTTTGSNNLNGGDLILASGGGDGTGTSSIQFKTKVSGTDAAAERMRIHTDGNVGIGTNAPGNMLHVAGADAYVLLQNTTDENGDGQAETRVIFADHAGNGLAQIEGSHSGSSDDDKGKLIFSTNNDSGLTTALTIDDTQLATFAGDVIVSGGDVTFANGQNATVAVATTGAGTDGRDLTIAAGSAPTGSANQNGGDLILASGGGDGNGTSIMTFATKTSAAAAAAERIRIGTNGNVVINGSTAHAASLAIDGASSSIALKEMANAPADTAAFGQLWVKNTTPTELYFTTDAGNDIQLTSGTSTAGGGTAANDVNLILHTQVFGR